MVYFFPFHSLDLNPSKCLDIFFHILKVSYCLVSKTGSQPLNTSCRVSCTSVSSILRGKKKEANRKQWSLHSEMPQSSVFMVSLENYKALNDCLDSALSSHSQAGGCSTYRSLQFKSQSFSWYSSFSHVSSALNSLNEPNNTVPYLFDGNKYICDWFCDYT